MHDPSSAILGGITLVAEPYGADGPQWVVAQAEAEIVLRYGDLDGDERGLTAVMFDPPNGAFLVARRDDAAGPPVGGVGVRAIHPGIGQIRRLWVDPARRRQGIARALLAGVEQAAHELGLAELRLGTGDMQPESVALYESESWQRVLVGPDGRPVPPRHIWFSKKLSS
jgi:GNAT superfamily N-acetyltransferase